MNSSDFREAVATAVVIEQLQAAISDTLAQAPSSGKVEDLTDFALQCAYLKGRRDALFAVVETARIRTAEEEQ